MDAIPATVLRRIVREAIEQHVDHGALAQLREIEQAERDFLSGLSFE